MEKSIKLIKEMYPEETLEIEKNTEDDTGIMACCFFAPNVLLEFINEFNENKLNRMEQLKYNKIYLCNK